MDSWNPMEEDFHNQGFNSYNRGPAMGLGGNESRGHTGAGPPNLKLHVGGLPTEMTNEGLTSLFSSVVKVRNAYVMPAKGDRQFTFGFVTVASVSDVEKAIRQLNGHRLKNFCLRINLAREPSAQVSQGFKPPRPIRTPDETGDAHDSMNGKLSPSPSVSSNSSKRAMNNSHDIDGDASASNGHGDGIHRDGRRKSGSSVHSPSPSPMAMMGMPCEECQRLWMAFTGHFQEEHMEEGSSPMMYPFFPFFGMGGGRRSRGRESDASDGQSPHPKSGTSEPIVRNLFNGKADDSEGSTSKKTESGKKLSKSNQYQREDLAQSDKTPPSQGRQEKEQPPQRFKQSPGPSAFGKPSPKNPSASPQRVKPVPMSKGVETTNDARSPRSPRGQSGSPRDQRSRKTPGEPKPCEACGKAGTKHCSKCYVTYCSIKCQKEDWARHKNKCKPNQPSDQTESDTSSGPYKLSAKDLVYVKPRPEEQLVIVTAASHPGSVWVQLGVKSHVQEYLQLQQMINKHVRTAGALTDPKPEMVCLVQSEQNEGWYRGTILSDRGQDVFTVRLVDFGNREDVPLRNLKPATAEMMTIPVQGVHCAIAGVEPRSTTGQWTPASGKLLRSLTEKPEMRAAFVGKEAGVYQIILKLEDEKQGLISVSDVLVEKDVAWPKKIADGNEGVPMISSLKTITVPVREKPVKIAINNYIDPREFHCQLVDDENKQKLENFSRALNEALGSQESGQFIPKVGQVCTGRFTEDNTWYRAHVMSAKGDGEYDVQYIDFGNCETISASRMCPLPARFIDFPRQSFKASFADIPPGDISQDVATATLQRLAQCTEGFFMATVSSKVDDTYHLRVAIPSTGEDIAMVTGLAPRVEHHRLSDLPREAVPLKCDLQYIATEVVSPAEFYGLFGTPEVQERRLKVTEGAAKAGSQPVEPNFKPRVGDLCCAQFSEDKEWYRAAVLEELPGNKFELQYIDFGNRERVGQATIRPIDKELATIPCLSTRCCLAGLGSETGPWKEEVTTSLKEMTGMGTKAVTARVTEFRDGTAYVELEDASTGLNISGEIINLIKESSSEPNQSPSGPCSLSSNPQAARGARGQAVDHAQSGNPPQSAPPGMSPDQIKYMEEQLAMLQAQLLRAKGAST
ncbi:tudor domain-containing protein 1-like [Diadema antillarum]|uniref:tudor domain-containing protein 1-like n=1 Tax=Diadema antillarum TaxID=105358 RepID=UPI003A8576F6